MLTYVEPPLDHWHIRSGESIDRSVLIGQIQNNAHRLGTGKPSNHAPLIATGHQAWLWHPGILAKDLVMTRFAQQTDADTFHLVVDQDSHESLHLQLPVIHDQRLATETIHLAATDVRIPTGWQPPVDPTSVQHHLVDVQQRLGDSLAVDLDPVIQAFRELPPCQTLAQQITVVLTRLRKPYFDQPIPVCFVSDVIRLPSYQPWLDHMLADATHCVRSYNHAVDHHPSAHIAKLRVEPDRVELPLWAVRWEEPRQRVFADLAGQSNVLTFDNGQPVTPLSPGITPTPENSEAFSLTPRAMCLTAILRQWCCDLFVHGRGGIEYDRATEQWWRSWQNKPLAPMTAVSADLPMNFSVPVADHDKLHHAQWWSHHIPHNLDRTTSNKHTPHRLTLEKRNLIDHMNDDRNPIRRATAYQRIHQINAQLAKIYPHVLTDAANRLTHAQIGVLNHKIATKRDWCFALYDPSQIQSLERELIS